MYIKQFCDLPRLHTDAVDCEHELINWECGIKKETAKILQN